MPKLYEVTLLKEVKIPVTSYVDDSDFALVFKDMKLVLSKPEGTKTSYCLSLL